MIQNKINNNYLYTRKIPVNKKEEAENKKIASSHGKETRETADFNKKTNIVIDQKGIKEEEKHLKTDPNKNIQTNQGSNLTLQEINDNSKSLITIKDFNSDVTKDDFKQPFPSDSVKKKKKPKTSSDYLRAHLIPEESKGEGFEKGEKIKKRNEAKSENVISTVNQTATNSYSDYQILKGF